MSALLDWDLWQPFFATLAVGTTLIVAAALLMPRWIRSMAWRRTSWQVAFLSVGLLAIVEISGAGRAMWSWMSHRSEPEPGGQRLVESRIIGEPDLRMLLAQGSQPVAHTASALPASSLKQEPVQWPGAIWLIGFVVALAWMAIARLVFVIWVPRRKVRDVNLLTRVASVARRLGVLKRVQVSETRGLAGPIAFGIFRPGISLPEGFASRFTHEQQDAMLAHELAHLVARDPFWHGLADMVTAMLWWHPLAWLAKREFRAASEAAADEASLVVENGPNLLAECLVELGGRLTRTHSLGWLGMAGADFRSGLGRRVKRLLSLNNQTWQPAQRPRTWLVRMAAPLVLVAAALAATLWAQPRLSGPSTLGQAFQRSVLGLALAAALPQAPEDAAETSLIDWQPWSPEALAEARAEGKTVLAHFTADWAGAGKANEQANFEVPAVRAKLRKLGAVALWGDYTVADEAITNELLAYGRTGTPLTLVYPPDPAFPRQVLPEVLTPQIILDALERGSSLSEKPASRIPTGSATSDRNRAPALILRGKSLQQAGKLSEARAKFEEALKLDPANLAAKHYLSLILQAAEPRGTNPSSRTNLVQSNRGSEAIVQESDVDDIIKNRIRDRFGDRTNFIKHLEAEQITYETYRQRERDRVSKLDSIRFEEVSFHRLSLAEVIEKLANMVKSADPDGKGINFILDNGPGQAQPFDFAIAPRPPLRDVPLRTVLDAIVECAESPLKYRVEEYAVVFSPGPPRPSLHTRLFRIDVHTFSRALLKALTTNTDQAIKEAIGAPPSLVSGTGRAQIVTATSKIQEDAHRYFTMAGVDFSQPGKALVFDERLGQLMVRATLQDLEIIEPAINLLTASPPQVTIEAMFCEVSADDVRALGLDWILGGQVTNLVKTAASTSTNLQATGILTDPQYRVVLRALEQRPGVKILAMPKVTTLSARQAQIKNVQVRNVVTGLDWAQVASNAFTATNGAFKVQPIVEPFELGPVLDVVPYVAADQRTIHMTLIAGLKEFLGYDSGPVREIVTTPDGRKEYRTVQNGPGPVFGRRHMVSTAMVPDGQTAVLFNGARTIHGVPAPLLGDLPYIGRLFRNEGGPISKTNLLIFVTPTLIDPAGNRLHSPEDVPHGDPRQANAPPSR